MLPNVTNIIKQLQDIKQLQEENIPVYVKHGAELLMLTGIETRYTEIGIGVIIHADSPRKIN